MCHGFHSRPGLARGLPAGRIMAARLKRGDVGGEWAETDAVVVNGVQLTREAGAGPVRGFLVVAIYYPPSGFVGYTGPVVSTTWQC